MLEIQEGNMNSWESPTLNPWQMQAPYVIKDPMTATVLWHTTEIQSKINATNILFINFYNTLQFPNTVKSAT